MTGRCHPCAGKQALPASTAEALRGSEADVRGQEPQGHRALGIFRCDDHLMIIMHDDVSILFLSTTLPMLLGAIGLFDTVCTSGTIVRYCKSTSCNL